MKQTKWLALITAMTLLTMLCSCKDSVTPSGGDSDGGGGTVAAGNVGDIALADIVINGTTYCVDGSEPSTNGFHVVSEIYQTYGILLLYSS